MNSKEASGLVLFLEPDALIRLAVAQYLRECGYTVVEGVAAADFHRLIDSGGQIHMVLVDVQLAHGTSGFEFARSIRQTHPHIDVILTSGVAGTAEHAHELCNEGPIRKPYQPKDLESRMRALLDRRRAQNRNLEADDGV